MRSSLPVVLVSCAHSLACTSTRTRTRTLQKIIIPLWSAAFCIGIPVFFYYFSLEEEYFVALTFCETRALHKISTDRRWWSVISQSPLLTTGSSLAGSPCPPQPHDRLSPSKTTSWDKCSPRPTPRSPQSVTTANHECWFGIARMNVGAHVSQHALCRKVGWT